MKKVKKYQEEEGDQQFFIHITRKKRIQWRRCRREKMKI